MTSSVYKAIVSDKLLSPPTGGKGAKRPSRVMRINLDVLSDLDDIRSQARETTAGYPNSPRNQRLVEFLDLLDEFLPMEY